MYNNSCPCNILIVWDGSFFVVYRIYSGFKSRSASGTARDAVKTWHAKGKEKES